MMEIKIKELERKDYNKVIGFAIDGMHFNRYVDNKLALRLYGRYFLYLELARATQVLAAYRGGRIAGILMADVKNEPKLYSSLLYSSFWRRLYVKIIKGILGLAVKSGSDTYDSANKALFEKFNKRAAPDGEICFLAADPAVHGKGIGSQLLDELSSREKGKLIYLFTDDNCTYQFYEHKGFERSEEKEIEMKLGGKTVPLTCLLYSKRL